MHDLDALRQGLRGFQAVGLRGRAIPGYIAEMEAGIAALEARPMDARAGYDEALRVFRESDLPYQVAQASTSMAYALGVADPTVRAIVAEAMAICTRLGATPLLRRLEQVLTDASEPTSDPATPDASPLPTPERGHSVTT